MSCSTHTRPHEKDSAPAPRSCCPRNRLRDELTSDRRDDTRLLACHYQQSRLPDGNQNRCTHGREILVLHRCRIPQCPFDQRTSRPLLYRSLSLSHVNLCHRKCTPPIDNL